MRTSAAWARLGIHGIRVVPAQVVRPGALFKACTLRRVELNCAKCNQRASREPSPVQLKFQVSACMGRRRWAKPVRRAPLLTTLLQPKSPPYPATACQIKQINAHRSSSNSRSAHTVPISLRACSAQVAGSSHNYWHAKERQGERKRRAAHTVPISLRACSAQTAARAVWPNKGSHALE